MKVYNPKSSVRKPMNYGGMANITGTAMSAGMRRDAIQKQNPMSVGMMGMKKGGRASGRNR